MLCVKHLSVYEPFIILKPNVFLFITFVLHHLADDNFFSLSPYFQSLFYDYRQVLGFNCNGLDTDPSSG